MEDIQQSQAEAEPQRYGWTVPDWSTSTGISRSSVYNLLAEGKIAKVKYGRRTLITTHPQTFLAGLPS